MTIAKLDEHDYKQLLHQSKHTYLPPYVYLFVFILEKVPWPEI